MEAKYKERKRTKNEYETRFKLGTENNTIERKKSQRKEIFFTIKGKSWNLGGRNLPCHFYEKNENTFSK